MSKVKSILDFLVKTAILPVFCFFEGDLHLAFELKSLKNKKHFILDQCFSVLGRELQIKALPNVIVIYGSPI